MKGALSNLLPLSYPPSGGVHKTDPSAGVVIVLVLVLTSRLEASVPTDEGQCCCCMIPSFGAQNISQVSWSEGGLINAGYIAGHQVSGLSNLLMYEGASNLWWLTCINPRPSVDGENSGTLKPTKFSKKENSSSSAGGGMGYIGEGEGIEFVPAVVAGSSSGEYLPSR